MARLRDICEKRVDTIKTTYEGDIDYIDISSVDNQRKEITQTQSMSIVDAPSRAKQLVYPGDILVSTVRPNLNAVALVTENSDNTLVASTGYCVLRCLPNVDNKYVFYFCQSPDFIEKMVAQATGASYPAVTSAIVKECTIPLPPLEEQRRIAALLDKVSDLIAKRRAQLDKLNLLVKARFVEMFGDLKRNTKNWKSLRFDDCFDITSSKRILKSEWKSTGIPFLRVRDMVQLATTGKMNSEFFVSEEYYATLSDSDGIPAEGDILVSATSTLGKCYIVKKDERFYFKDADVLRFRAKCNINPVFFIELMKTDYIEEQILKTLGVTTVAHFTIKAAKTIHLRFPDLNIQNQFAAFVEETDKSKLTIQQSLDKLEIIKKALMQQYFG